MDATLLGLVLDSSVLIAAERRNLTAAQAIESVRKVLGALPILLSAMSVAEIGHGIYRANTAALRDRRRTFLDDLVATIPIHPITETTAEIVAQIGAEQASKGNTLPLADLFIGACALELGYTVVTSNIRDFSRIPGLRLKQI